MQARLLSLILFTFLMAGCALLSSSSEDSASLPELTYPEPDPETEFLLDSYRDSLDIMFGNRVAEVTDTIRFGKPESAMGNLVADALRFRAASELRRFIHVGIIGQDSFKLYFTPGMLTVAHVYEFMPYDNHLVVLTLTGEKVKELTEQVAKAGGAPVSGIRFNMKNGNTASGILVNAEIIDTDREYYVATSNYQADGGGIFPALWDPLNRIDLDVPLKDLYIDYFRSKRNLAPVTDGRIR